MYTLRFNHREMHIFMIFASIKEEGGATRVLDKSYRKVIDALRLEARAMTYLLAGVEPKDARELVGACDEPKWQMILSVYREMEAIAESMRRESKARAERREERRRCRFAFA